MRPVRIAATFAALMLATAVAAPSVGAFDERVNTGRTGFYTIPDDGLSPGVACRYEDHPGQQRDELNKISVRQIWTHGPWARWTWIGHRVVIQARRTAASPWVSVWKSPLVKKRANTTNVAFFGPYRYFTPENHRRQYRVVHKLIYYQKRSQTQAAGKVKGLVEVYKHVQKGQPAYTRGQEGGPGAWCQRKFWPVP